MRGNNDGDNFTTSTLQCDFATPEVGLHSITLKKTGYYHNSIRKGHLSLPM